MRIDGVPEAEPVPQVDLRERRLRPAVRGERNASVIDEKVERRCVVRRLWDEVKDRLQRPRVQSLRRPAAASVHRARARHRPEILLFDEPTSALDPIATAKHRGTDQRTQGKGHHPDRHPQHAAGRARLGLHRVHVHRRADRVRRYQHHLHQPEECPRSNRPRITSPAVSAERRPAATVFLLRSPSFPTPR
jgi:hypothetical protein